MRLLLIYLYLAVTLPFIAIYFFRRFKQAEDPGGLVFRFFITALCFGVCIFMLLKGWGLLVPFVAVAFGVLLSTLWTPTLAGLISNPLGSLYDGGSAEVEARPLYSIAEGLRKRGRYEDAIREAHRQMERFPEDYEGWMKIAEIQAVDIGNYEKALETAEYILGFEKLSPRNTAYVMGRMSDWALARSDRPAAEAALQRIIDTLPDTPEAQMAAQRIAHLASAEHIAEMRDPRVVSLKRHEDKIGLRGERVAAPEDESPAVTAQRYVQHLAEHPLDNEVREQLAKLYANEFRRLDMAVAELEQLIATPNQLPKNVVHWLNQIADFQVRLDAGAEAARETLQRIIDLYPNTAAASNANVRQSQLRLEMKHGAQTRTIKMGAYEQNVGLRKMNSSGEMKE